MTAGTRIGDCMLKLSLKQGQYINIGDNIRVVYVGGSGGHGRLMIDAPKEIPIVRSNIEENPERRRETYYPEEKISAEAQKKIQRILWEERHKGEAENSKFNMVIGRNTPGTSACYRSLPRETDFQRATNHKPRYVEQGG